MCQGAGPSAGSVVRSSSSPSASRRRNSRSPRRPSSAVPTPAYPEESIASSGLFRRHERRPECSAGGGRREEEEGRREWSGRGEGGSECHTHTSELHHTPAHTDDARRHPPPPTALAPPPPHRSGTHAPLPSPPLWHPSPLLSISLGFVVLLLTEVIRSTLYLPKFTSAQLAPLERVRKSAHLAAHSSCAGPLWRPEKWVPKFPSLARSLGPPPDPLRHFPCFSTL